MENTFEQYLSSKKINAFAFKKAEAALYASLEELYMQVHPKSFTLQKLFLINGLRRRFPDGND